MLQDDCRDLSRWLANKPDARHVFRKNLTMKTKTSELTGAALDWAVATAQYGYGADGATNRYSTDWAHGGPIIAREGIDTIHERNCDGEVVQIWAVQDAEQVPKYFGCTPLIAAMRCFVASKLGDEVEIPNELA